jgi:prolyl-tRNA editing enzyme YbaK/EbsC (Cys-tRNA(Pro) deacylase)
MSNYALRLPESLKQAAKRIAAADDTTMNQFFVVAIAEKISAMEAAQFFEKRAAMSTPEAAEAAWGKVGTHSPVTEDAWTSQAT